MIYKRLYYFFIGESIKNYLKRTIPEAEP